MALNDFVCLDIEFEILMERDGGSVIEVAEGVEKEDNNSDIMHTLLDTANVVHSLPFPSWKDVPDSALESCNIVQELIEKSSVETDSSEKNV